MRRKPWTSIVACAVACGVSASTIAVAQSAADNTQSVGAGPGGPAGAAQAKSAGIAIDPAAAPLMSEAPSGSCLNAPAGKGCPPVTKIVRGGFVVEVVKDDGAAIRRAKTRQVINLCRMTVYPPEIYYSGTHKARGSTAVVCIPPVVYNQAISTLQRTDYGWQNLDSAAQQGPPGPIYTATARYDCNHQSVQHYRTQGLGYAVKDGIGYTEVGYAYADHTCPS